MHQEVSKQKNSTYRVIISGGGTGGHIYPAVAVANEIRFQFPGAEILFVGANGKMEMEKVPKEGFEIVGLPVRGLQRRLTLKNLLVPFVLLWSLIKAYSIVKKFKPNVVVGFGGYASAPVLRMAEFIGIKTVLQEQNSYAGLTNKLLAKKSKCICVAYPNMGTYFQKEKIVFTGNPVRGDIISLGNKSNLLFANYNLNPDKKTVLVVGGSLGARTVNEAILANAKQLESLGIQVLCQCGSFYYKEIEERLAQLKTPNIHLREFIYDMDKAYTVADIIVSRAGALSISELCLVGKPTLLVPSPNVAEDHQTKNAMALVKEDAAVMIKDTEISDTLVSSLTDLLQNENKCQSLSQNIKALGKPDAAKDIVKTIFEL